MLRGAASAATPFFAGVVIFGHWTKVRCQNGDTVATGKKRNTTVAAAIDTHMNGQPAQQMESSIFPFKSVQGCFHSTM